MTRFTERRSAASLGPRRSGLLTPVRLRRLAGAASLLTLALVSGAAFAEDPWADVRPAQPGSTGAPVTASDAGALIPAPTVGTPAPRATAPVRKRLALPATAPLPPVRPQPHESATATGTPAADELPVPVADLTGDEPSVPAAPVAPADPFAANPAVTSAASRAEAGPAGADVADLVPAAPASSTLPATLNATRTAEASGSTLSWDLLGAPLATLFPPAFAAPAQPEREATALAGPMAPALPTEPGVRRIAMGTLTDIVTSVTGSSDSTDASAEEATKNGATDAPGKDAESTDAANKDAAGGDGKSNDTAEAPPPPPLFRNLRQLQRLQDRMVRGEPNALDEQNALLMALDLEFRSVDVSAWKDPNNARALVLYVLSGGSPKTVRSVLAKGADPNIDPRLVRGALAYVEGREADAVKDLGEIDARSLPASLAGQVALAQAALWVRKDQTRAALLLDQARVLAPGTLVEEGALRRAILIAAQANDLDTFERLTATYLGRFRHSVYAGNFRQRFAAALTRMSFIDNADEFHRIDNVLRPIEPEGRRDILLIIAQGAVVQGKTEAAILAADRVLKAAPIASLDAQRATLYRGAAMAASSTEYVAAGKQLRSVSRDRLASADLALLDTALSVVNSIEQAGLVTLAAADPATSTAATTGSGTPSATTSADPNESAAISKANELLDSTGKLLTEAPL